MRYLFTTTPIVTDENYYINESYIPDKYIAADNLADALNEYVKFAAMYDIEITKNGLRNKSDMYIGTADGDKQTGYVIAARTLLDNGIKWVRKNLELWVDIKGIVDIEF